jgi:hypothetical protein
MIGPHILTHLPVQGDSQTAQTYPPHPKAHSQGASKTQACLSRQNTTHNKTLTNQIKYAM